MVQNAQKQSVDAAEESDKAATYIAAQFAESILRSTEVEENAKVAT